MRAAVINEYGESPVVTDLPTPRPGPGQVLIGIRAAGMNPMDRKIADGLWKDSMPSMFPMVLGYDFAGVIESVGNGAARFSAGDAVFGQVLIAPLGSTGTYAQEVAVPESAPIAKVPSGLDDEVAASLPTAGGTALDIVDLLEPLSGKTVLIVGAGGGVGSFATQLAVNAGAHVIANSRASAAGRMRAYGAAETVDHTTVSLPDSVREAHPEGIDILVDVANGADAFADLASLVRPGGTALTTLRAADADALAERGVTGVNFEFRASGETFQRLADAIVGGVIVPPPIHAIKLDDVPAEWNRARDGHADGKTVITP